MAQHDYSEYAETQPDTHEAFKRLNELVAEKAAADAEVAEAEAALKQAQARQRAVSEVALPELMDELGLTTFETKSGLKVNVAEKIRVSVPAARRDAAYDWLEQHGHSGLIKRQVSVAFNKDQEEDAQKLLSEIQPRFPDCKSERQVHPSTMRSFVISSINEGEEIPLDLFGVYRQRIAEVK